jgi:hypothetical protein
MASQWKIKPGFARRRRIFYLLFIQEHGMQRRQHSIVVHLKIAPPSEKCRL